MSSRYLFKGPGSAIVAVKVRLRGGPHGVLPLLSLTGRFRGGGA